MISRYFSEREEGKRGKQQHANKLLQILKYTVCVVHWVISYYFSMFLIVPVEYQLIYLDLDHRKYPKMCMSQIFFYITFIIFSFF